MSTDERQFTIDDKFLDKLRKVAALRESPNEHEAALAAARLQELLFKYNLDMAQISGAAVNREKYEKYHEFVGDFEWKKSLFNVVANTNFCKALFDGAMPDYMWLLGKQHNKEVAVYLYEYLAKELERLADFELGIQRIINMVQDRKSKIWAKTWRTSFVFGAIPVIEQRLKEQWNKNANESSTAMVLVQTNERELMNFARENFRLSNHTQKLGAIHADGSAAGRRVGAEIPLNRGISSNPNGRKELS